jgi:hypothetical protein
VSRELVEAKLQLVLVDFGVESWRPASQVLNEITLRLMARVIEEVENVKIVELCEHMQCDYMCGLLKRV